MTWTTGQPGFISWPEVANALAARPHPELPEACNLVLLYACDTLNANDPATPFGTTVPGRATAGFGDVVWTHGKEVIPGNPPSYGSLFTLDQHVILLRKRLNEGYSLGRSLLLVQSKLMTGKFEYDANGHPIESSFQAVPMEVSYLSDSNATAIHVFLTGAERQSNVKYPNWFIFLGEP